MRLQIRNIVLWMYVILSTLTCALKPSEFGRQVYPTELRAAGGPDLSIAMLTLAHKVDSLNSALSVNPRMLSLKRKEVLQHLEEMEKVAQSLRDERRKTQHPMFDEHMQLFLNDVTEAKIRVNANPPNYFEAGKIAGSCQYCHGSSPFAAKFGLPRTSMGIPR